MASKELLSEVLGIEIIEHTGTYIYGGIMLKYAPRLNKKDMTIRINDLIQKMEDYITNQGYSVTITRTDERHIIFIQEKFTELTKYSYNYTCDNKLDLYCNVIEKILKEKG